MEASRSYAYQQNRFKMLTPAGLEVQIFVDPKDAKNVPTELKEQILSGYLGCLRWVRYRSTTISCITLILPC